MIKDAIINVSYPAHRVRAYSLVDIESHCDR